MFYYLDKTMTEREYLMLDGEGWTMSVKFKEGIVIPKKTAGARAISDLVYQLLSDGTAEMTFDEHPRTVSALSIDFEKKTVKISA